MHGLSSLERPAALANRHFGEFFPVCTLSLVSPMLSFVILLNLQFCSSRKIHEPEMQLQ